MALRAGSGSYQVVREVTLDPSNIPGYNVAVETFTPSTLVDLTTDSIVKVTGTSFEAGVIITSARVSAVSTLEITFHNTNATAVNPASQTFKVIVL